MSRALPRTVGNDASIAQAFNPEALNFRGRNRTLEIDAVPVEWRSDERTIGVSGLPDPTSFVGGERR